MAVTAASLCNLSGVGSVRFKALLDPVGKGYIPVVTDNSNLRHEDSRPDPS